MPEAEPVDHKAATFAAETICEVTSGEWKEGTFRFDALTVARAYLALRVEMKIIDQAFGNPSALNDCETRYDKICKMFREIERLSHGKPAR